MKREERREGKERAEKRREEKREGLRGEEGRGPGRGGDETETVYKLILKFLSGLFFSHSIFYTCTLKEEKNFDFER